jgi:hypothetical protein
MNRLCVERFDGLKENQTGKDRGRKQAEQV